MWVYDLNRGTATRLTDDGKADFVTWTPDGKRVVFDWLRSGVPNLYWQACGWKRSDGAADDERLRAVSWVMVS